MAAPGEWKTYVKYMLRPLSHLYATHYMACGEDCGIFQFGKKAFDEGKIANWFEKEFPSHTFMEKLISRKKQIVPLITEIIQKNV